MVPGLHRHLGQRRQGPAARGGHQLLPGARVAGGAWRQGRHPQEHPSGHRPHQPTRVAAYAQ
eukprot:4624827-Lingulodinium_polyedra.AAC.1